MTNVLDASLARRFAKATAARQSPRADSESRAVAKVVDGKVYAILSGSTAVTPVETTVTVNDGDELVVSVKDHRALVVGNVTSNALDTATFYRLLEDGSLSIAVNNLDIMADGSVTVGAGADFSVVAGGTVNFNDRLVLDDSGKLLLAVDGLYVESGGDVNIDDKIVLGEDGHLSLAVDSLSIGESAGIEDIDDLRGAPGRDGSDGKDGRDGVDVTSQYVYYRPDYGLCVTSEPNSVEGPHLQMLSDKFNFRDGEEVLTTVDKSKGLLLANGTAFGPDGVLNLVYVPGTVNVKARIKSGSNAVKLDISLSTLMGKNGPVRSALESGNYKPLHLVRLTTSNYGIVKLNGFDLNPSAKNLNDTALTLQFTRNGTGGKSTINDKKNDLDFVISIQIGWMKCSIDMVKNIDLGASDLTGSGSDADSGGDSGGSSSSLSYVLASFDSDTGKLTLTLSD